MKYTLIRTFLAAVAVFFAVRANAADNSRTGEVSSTFPKATPVEDVSELSPHLGVKVGVANPEGSYDSAPEFGIDVGMQPYIPFGIGLAYTQSRNVSRSGAHDLERATVLARATYNFGGTTPVVKNSWVGVAAGPVFRYNGTDVGVAPIVGFDIPMKQGSATGKYLSLGADAKYLALVNSDEADALSVNGTVKYWF